MMEALTVKDCQSLADEIGLQVLLLTLDEVDNGHVEQMSFFFLKLTLDATLRFFDGPKCYTSCGGYPMNQDIWIFK